MKFFGRLLLYCGILITYFSNANAAPNFGAMASGSELSSPGIVQDGGAGSSSASISRSNFNADASFLAGATYLPELAAFSRNTTASNSDDITQSTAEAYQVFTSSVAQTIDLNISLHGIVVNNSTDISFVLADVFVYGGDDFDVFDSPICPDGSLGKFMFDRTYFCGSRLDRSNLFIDDGDVTLPDVLTFDVPAGATFGVYAILRANSSGGSADATQTLSLNFRDDEFISAVDIPSSGPVQVGIDIKPGSDPNSINTGSKGVIPVAILTTDVFDALQVDVTTLAFGPDGAGIAHQQGHVEDVDDDGDLDLVVHFRTRETGIVCGDTDATLTGETFAGDSVSGADTIKTVGKNCK